MKNIRLLHDKTPAGTGLKLIRGGDYYEPVAKSATPCENMLTGYVDAGRESPYAGPGINGKGRIPAWAG